MSVTSSRRSTIGFGDRSVPATNGDTKKVLRFKMPHSSRVKHILQNYVDGENVREYEQLICSIRDNVLQDEEIVLLLDEATQCISLLNEDLRLFVEAILVLQWSNKDDRFVKKYKSFLINLLCAHNYHTKHALDKLVSLFLSAADEPEWVNGIPSDTDCKNLSNIHSVIQIILNVIPMSREMLLQSIISHYPYIKKPTHQHEYYLHNMLWILEYQPEFKIEFLNFIFNRLIILDVNAPREEILKAENGDIDEEIFTMDDEKSVKSCATQNNFKDQSIAHTLDVCLDKIFNYFISESYNLETAELDWDKTKNLYQLMISVFDKIILPTYNIHHVQFVMFFLCSMKITICEAFLIYLWKKVCDPNVPSIHRQTAVAYIASLLARATFIPLNMLKSTVEQMTAWIHAYISTQDGLEYVNSDVRLHSVFYSVCQAIFYVVAFRYRDLVNSKKNITFLENLNLAKIVTCRLNPLKVCQSAIVQNFAAIARTYQLAYCYSIIEHNARSTMPTVYLDEKGCMTTASTLLDAFFPFDPYLLKRSGQKIAALYLEYKDIDNADDEGSEKMEEDDDFLDHSGSSLASSSRNSFNRFSYGTSPGFKYKT